MTSKTSAILGIHKRSNSQKIKRVERTPSPRKDKQIRNIFQNKLSVGAQSTDRSPFNIKKTDSFRLVHHRQMKSQGKSSFLKKDISAIPEEITMLSDPNTKFGSARYHVEEEERTTQRKELLLKYHSRHASGNLEALKSFVNDVVKKKEVSKLISPRTQDAFFKVIQKKENEYKKFNLHEELNEKKSQEKLLPKVKINYSNSQEFHFTGQTNHPNFRRSISHVLNTPQNQKTNYEIIQPNTGQTEQSSDQESVLEKKINTKLKEKPQKTRLPQYIEMDGINELFLFEKYPVIQFDSSLVRGMNF